MSFLKRGLTAIATIAVLAVMATFISGASASQSRLGATAQAKTAVSQGSQQGDLTSMVKGSFGKSGVVTGTFMPDRFIVKNGKVYGVGMLHAKLTKADGTVVGTTNKFVQLPVHSASYGKGAQSKAVCDILDLVLGPLHLNLLGLHVDLKKVVLHITAVPGSGNLLGNLLCAIAHLLDGTHLSTLLKLANVLNQILSILRV